MRQKLTIHIGILPDGYCSVEVFTADNVSIHEQEVDPGYEVEPVKHSDDEDEGILYDNLD